MEKEKLTQKTEELIKQSVQEQISLENTSSTDYFEPVEETKKGKQKAVAMLKDKVLRAEGFFQSIGLELDRDC